MVKKTSKMARKSIGNHKVSPKPSKTVKMPLSKANVRETASKRTGKGTAKGKPGKAVSKTVQKTSKDPAANLPPTSWLADAGSHRGIFIPRVKDMASVDTNGNITPKWGSFLEWHSARNDAKFQKALKQGEMSRVLRDSPEIGYFVAFDFEGITYGFFAQMKDNAKPGKGSNLAQGVDGLTPLCRTTVFDDASPMQCYFERCQLNLFKEAVKWAASK